MVLPVERKKDISMLIRFVCCLSLVSMCVFLLMAQLSVDDPSLQVEEEVLEEGKASREDDYDGTAHIVFGIVSLGLVFLVLRGGSSGPGGGAPSSSSCYC